MLQFTSTPCRLLRLPPTAPPKCIGRLATYKAIHQVPTIKARWYTDAAASKPEGVRKSLMIPTVARHNDIRVQQLSDHVYKQVFPNAPEQSVSPNAPEQSVSPNGGQTVPPELIELSKEQSVSPNTPEQSVSPNGGQTVPPELIELSKEQSVSPNTPEQSGSPKGRQTVPIELIELSKEHLKHHQLLDKNSDKSPPIGFDIPPLVGGKSLDEHFHKLGTLVAEPYLTIAKEFVNCVIPKQPKKWIKQPGWTKYEADKPPVAVDAPEEEALVFDTEVLYKISPFAIMACAVSPTAWYAWLSPWLLDVENDPVEEPPPIDAEETSEATEDLSEEPVIKKGASSRRKNSSTEETSETPADATEEPVIKKGASSRRKNSSAEETSETPADATEEPVIKKKTSSRRKNSSAEETSETPADATEEPVIKKKTSSRRKNSSAEETSETPADATEEPVLPKTRARKSKAESATAETPETPADATEEPVLPKKRARKSKAESAAEETSETPADVTEEPVIKKKTSSRKKRASTEETPETPTDVTEEATSAKKIKKGRKKLGDKTSDTPPEALADSAEDVATSSKVARARKSTKKASKAPEDIEEEDGASTNKNEKPEGVAEKEESSVLTEEPQMEEFAQRALEEDLKERDLGADEELIPQKQYENDSSVAQPILPSQAKQNSISTNRKTPLSTGHNQRREIHYSRSLYNEVIGDTENSVENVEAGTEGVVSHEENNNEERITTGFEEATEEKHPGMQETPDEPSDGAKPKSEGIPAAERIKVSDRQLIPLGNPTVDRVVIGHNIGYDRARIKEEYNIKQTKTAYLDTMSLHVAVNGMCSRQRPTWLKHKKNVELKSRMMTEAYSDIQKQSIEDSTFEDGLEELWIGKSAINSLKDVALFHCNKTIDKGVRDQFGIIDRRGVLDQLDTLLDYCASDVVTTFEVYQKVLPEFLSVCPHPVSFGALRHLSSVILPVTEEWQTYIERAENKYQELLGGVNASLVELVEQAIAKFEEGGKERVLEDPWLSQLDWTAEEQRYLKLKKGQLTPTPARQRLVGKPKWYRDIVKKEGDIPAITTRSRAAVLLLGVAWDGYPLVWSDINGWTFKVPNTEVDKYKDKNVTKCDFSGEEKQLNLKEDTEHTYFKVPHKDGPTARCVTPMSKSFVKAFEDGILCGNTDVAKKALEMNAQCSYWISSRERIKSQMVVYEDDIEDMGTKDLKVPEGTEKKKLGIILPQLIPMGTITRRAVERTWLTASNAKKNRVGSELKSMVTAPPGYVFVGADVDSQELWIASLVGDAQLKIHGGTALGFMTLEGAKANGTDLHSKTASILGISRNHAKVFNYGRIYGAGLKFATTLLRQFNPSISDAEAEKTAENLYIQTKGKKVQRKNLMMVDKPFWYGGTESFVFNCLEDFADQERPRTPVLGSGLTMALLREYLTKGGFMTSRINWAIQSSGVDYLHLLVVSMDYLIRQYKIDARLAITVHDEIRYLVKEEDKYRSAMALQVANLWTRAMFSQQMGIEDLPQSCAYFSAVDIDHVLRKEVDLDCITPSHPEPIPHGESIDIIQLLEKGEVAALALDLEAENRFAKEFSEMVYQKREPVMETLQKSKGDFADQLKYMKAQMAKDEKAVVEVLKSWKQESTKPTKSTKSTASGNRNGNAVPWRKQETTQKSFPNYLPPSRPKPVYTLMMPKAKPAQQQPQEQAASKTSSTPEKTLAKNVNSK